MLQLCYVRVSVKLLVCVCVCLFMLSRRLGGLCFYECNLNWINAAILLYRIKSVLFHACFHMFLHIFSIYRNAIYASI